MNRFLNRKKTEEAHSANNDALAQLSTPPVSPGLKKSGTSRWKKNNNNNNNSNKKQPEPKPEIDIAGVLPSSDDFRTSLLMPNLTQRFSMLREQDNPDSLIGKASDDSVLQPRRRSHMLDFGYGSNDLGDIAEVQSINSSIRPPFAHNTRQDSYGSEEGYGSENDGGSVMSRARPGEGNVMFGGRQKVYMIPKSGANSSKSLGRAVYEDDLGKSAFQKHRQRERELQDARGMELPEDPQSFDFGLGQAEPGEEGERSTASMNDSARDLSHSPSLSSYEKKRSTTSSTARSEARSSTAATSIASQPTTITPSQAPVPPPSAPPPAVPGLERSNTKARRLYEQGLDQHMHDQQASALTRLNSIQRQRGFTGKASPPILHGAKSAGNLTERPPQNVYAYQTQRSPPVAPLASLGPLKNKGSPIGSGPSSPLSPSVSEFDESNVLSQALQPGDRGKATAMGAFNKPKQAFDENQYMERQMALQRSASTAANTRQTGASSAFQQRMGRFEQEREHSASENSARSRSRSASGQADTSKAFNVFQNAASRNQTQAGASPAEKPSYPDTHRTFFGNISASDSEDEGDESYRHESPYAQQDQGYGYGRWQPTVLPSVSEHPALRFDNSKPTLVEENEEAEEPTPQTVPSIHTQGPSVRQEVIPPPTVPEADLDSPTLGPSSEGLGHMMHHLRSKSDASSMYPQQETQRGYDEAPNLPIMSQDNNLDVSHPSMRSGYDTESRIESTYTNSNSNPWDLDEAEGTSYFYGNDEAGRASASPMDGAQPRNTLLSSRAPSRATAQLDRQSATSRYSEASSWQTELVKQHARNASTATQQERAAFDNELAARRNAIQESIKSMVETDESRNASPAPSAGGALKAFMLRSKSSRDSMDTRREAPSKAMKMLGIGAVSSPASTTNLNSQYERGGMSLDGNRPRGNSASRPPMPGRTLQQSDQDARREHAQSRARGDSDTSRFERPIGRSPASSSETSRGRMRSNSEATTGRSRSRTGPYRDDLEKAMVEGTGSSAYAVPELSPMITHEPSPRTSPDSVQSQFEGESRTRSNSRVGAMTNYFDGKIQQTPMPNRLAAGGPSPALSPNAFASPGGSAQPSSAIKPFHQTATPPISGNNTPVGASFSPPPMPPGPSLRSAPLRKKTVSKSDISEPVALLSSTSNVDTIDLPAGASLKNGMDGPPPPVPPINPKRRGARRMFGLGRSPSTEQHDAVAAARSKTPDPWLSRSPEPDTIKTNAPAVAPPVRPRNFSNAQHSSPAVHQMGFEQNGFSSPGAVPYGSDNPAPPHPYGYEAHAFSSPERINRSQPPPQSMEGGFI